MPDNSTTIDHLVYGVHDLAAASDWFEALSGIRPVFGGYHKNQGTKNALVDLGGQCYLEFIAIDPDNQRIAPPRWMGIDLLTAPKLLRWAVRSIDLEAEAALLEKYRPGLGIISEGQRQTSAGDSLRWRMSLPAAAPEVEAMPFLLDWSQSAIHPTQQLPQSCSLEKLVVQHPRPDALRHHLAYDVAGLNFRTGPVALRASLRTELGTIWI